MTHADSFNQVWYPAFCTTSYLIISYYSVGIILSDQFSLDSTTRLDTDPRFAPAVWTMLCYILFDTVYKTLQYHWWYTWAQPTGLYIALQMHHLLTLFGTAYVYQMSIANSYMIGMFTFEITSIPLLFYWYKIYPQVSLWLTWMSFIPIRLIWGTFIQLYTFSQFDQITDPIARLIITLGFVFSTTTNYWWFYRLTQKILK